MQNDPNQTTKLMGNGPDGLIMSQARLKTAMHDVENASFVLDRGVGRLLNPAIAELFK